MRMKKVAKRLLGGAISVALTMAMVLGIFAGTGMEVRAAETKEVTFYNVNQPAARDVWQRLGKVSAGTEITFRAYDEDRDLVECYLYAFYLSDGGSGIDLSGAYSDFGAFASGTGLQGRYDDLFKDVLPESNTQTLSVGTADGFSELWNVDVAVMSMGALDGKSFVVILTPATEDATPTSTGGQNDSKDAKKQPAAPHTHSYSWVTVQDASVGQDGLEEYRCSCGDVQERCVIPASAVAVKGLYGVVKDAPQNGTATFDSGRLYTISDYVIKKLAERTDVTTVITFEYQNQAYKMTIPAGVDYTPLLSDGDYFYGYFYFANAVGATIEAVA